MDQLTSQAREIATVMKSLVECCTDREATGYSQFGLTVAEGRFLQALSEQHFSSPSAAAQILSVARSRITQIVNGLVTKGLIERSELAGDRRFQSLHLTDKGQETLRHITDYLEDVHVRLLSSFEGDKRQSLIQDLNLLKEKIDIIRQEIDNAARPTSGTQKKGTLNYADF
ncbi:MarR family winged helix-turn-helix transcriptional regulator [bacterium]|nr:MarR family winged helix-turn-helix transcriptional regulator [bacterium]